MRTAVYTARDRLLANLLWREGPLSRAELMDRTGVHRNLVGTSADRLLKLGLVREADARVVGPGRPSVPLEIDAFGKTVVGLSIEPGRVEAVRLSLRGGRVGEAAVTAVRAPDRLVATAAAVVAKLPDRGTFALGVGVPGLIDLPARTLLFSSAASWRRDVSLAPLYRAAGDLPLVIDNDEHALAARWLLTHRAAQGEDVLLVGFDDGQMGAAHLVQGRPSRGCLVSASELGHTRLPIETAECHCGHTGCLERICSSGFVRQHGGKPSLTLAAVAADPRLSPAAFDRLTDALACGLSNATNFTRPHRLVLATPLSRCAPFVDAVTRQVHRRVLPALAERVRIEWWDRPSVGDAENAGWLALAAAFYDGWGDATVEYDTGRRADATPKARRSAKVT